MTPTPYFEPKTWERNGTGFMLTHIPRRISVAIYDGGDVLGWLTEADAHLFAAILDRMFTDPPPTYGGATYGSDDG
jgi:hypothetical protein